MAKYPILYAPDADDFFNMGLGPLTTSLTATVVEERNGSFILEVEVLTDDAIYPLIEHNGIIKADAGHKLKDQLFRIKRIVPTEAGKAQIYAEHVSYLTQELSMKPDLKITGVNANAALARWKSALNEANPFVVDSDISTVSSTSWRIDKVANPRQALGGVEGSLLDIYGGEYRFDNYHISLLKKRGTTANTVLAYGRNIKTFEQEENLTSTYTSVYPYAIYKDENDEDVLLTIDGYTVHCANISSFPNPVVKPIDFSSEFEQGTAPTKAKLKSLAEAYIVSNDFGVPSVSIKVSFVDLSKTADYAEYQALEEVNLCDDVRVIFPKLGVSTVAKVTRTVWNVLSESYDEIEIGERRASLSTIINDQGKQIGKAEENANNAMVSANGKNTTFYGLYGPDGLGEPKANKVGDLWYKPNGDETEMYQWNGTVWEFVMSTAPDPELIEAIEEVGKKVEQAQSDADQALTNANDAVDKANQAAAKADASGQAAQLAIEQSANALSEAEEAKTDATDALANANQAQDDATKALDDITNLDTVNLLPNSTWNSGQGTWTVGFNGRYEILQPEEDKPNSNILHGLPLTTTTQQLSNMPHPIYVKAGQHYALAFDFKELNFSASKSILFLRIFPEKTTPNTSADALWSQSLKHATFGITSNVTQWRRLTYTFVAPSTGWLDVVPYDSDESGIHETFYREIMFVKSSVVPKSWTPYPGDVKIQIDNINGELSQKVSQSTFDVLNQTVVNQATQINQNATDIALKANQSTVDNLAGRVTDAEASIDLNAKEIKLKASQKTVDTIAGRVDTAEASLVTMAGEIELKASQTSVDTLSDTVESVQSELKVEAGKISALNTLTDGHTTQIGSLQTGYDGLSSTVALVQNRFTDGNNLITDGDFESGLNRGIELYQVLESYPKPSGNYAAKLYVNGTAGTEYTQQWTLPAPITLLANTEYTIEYDYSVAGTARGTASDYARDENGNWISGIMMEKSQHVLTGGQTVWKKYVNTFKLNQETVLSRLRFGFVLNGDGVGWKTIDNIKIYQGSSIVTQFSNLTQEIDTIQATVANNEANTQAQLIILSDQITSTVGQLRDGNNLIDDGGFESGNGRGLSLIGQTDTYPKPSGNYMARLIKTGGTVAEDYYQIWTLPTPITLLANTEYTIEYDYSVAGTARGNASDYLRTATGSWVSGVMMDHESHSLVGGQGVWKKYTKTFSLSAETTISAMRFGFVLNGNGTGWKVIDNIKIYQGASTQSQITQLADRMNFRITNSDGSVTQIDLANKVISLSGEQVNITGNTYIEAGVIKTAAIADAAITNAKIGNISASKVTTGELNAANVNIINLNASNIVSGELTGITIKSAANGSLFQVRGNDLYMQKANGDNLTMSTSGIYWYDSAGEILFQSSKKLTTSDIFGTAEYNAYLAAFNETRSVTYASALKGQGGVNDYTYVAHRASKIFANQMEINTGTGNPTHLYLKTSSADADVRVAVAGDGDISYARLRAGGLFGNFVSINTQTNAVQLYLQTADEVRVKNTGNDAAGASYKAVRASAFNTSSLAEYKTNIKPFDQSALALIKASTVYEYNLKSDLATQEIGLVIGDGYDIADIVVNGDGVSQYRMGSLAWKAIQELNQKIETLEQEIRVLQAA